MARKKTESVPDTPKTVSAIKQGYQNFAHEKMMKNYADAKTAYKQLRDVSKTSTKKISTFNKESLRTYLSNIGSNEKNLRNLSRYLYFRSHTYSRLINFYSTMFDLSARQVIPPYDLLKGGDAKKMQKSFQETLAVLENMNLNYEMMNAYTTCFIEDVFYGIVIYDETGFFVYRVDPDYAKISGKYPTGDFAFKMDMTYWRSRQTELEFLGEPFTSMYSAYGGNNVNRWQDVPDENCLCLKFRSDDWELCISPFVAMFESLINLADLESIQAIAEEQQIYKMIWMEMETRNSADTVNEWKVDPQLSVDYFDIMTENAIDNDYISAAIVPGKLQSIDFSHDSSTDVKKIQNATEAILNTAGGAEVLNGATIKNAAGFTSAAKANTEFAISSLLPQTQAWLNRFLTYHVSDPCKVKFFPISIYTKDEFKKNLLESSQYGYSNKLAYNTLNNISEFDTLAMNFFEEEVLGLSDKFKPLQSSHTASSSGMVSDGSDGRPVKEDGDISSEGERSRDKK